MINVLVAIEIVKCLAKDVHYRSNDEWFYALHLLADKVDFGSAEDDLKEAYYLGMHEELPPTEMEILKATTEKCQDIRALSNKELVSKLYEACSDGVLLVEDAKREAGLLAGVHAILDGVSQTMLVIKGLCWRTLNSETEKQ